MKKLVLSVLVTSVVSGSLFASQNHNMTKEECLKMHKKANKKNTTFEKHLKILKKYEHQSTERNF